MSQPPYRPYPEYPERESPQYPGYPPAADQGQSGYAPGFDQPYSSYGQQAEQPYGGYRDSAEQPYPGQPPVAEGTPPPHPAPSGPDKPKKSAAGKIILITLAVVLLLCGGGVAVAVFALKDDVQEVVQATRTEVVAPDELAGRPKITTPELQEVADQMVTTMQRDIDNATGAVGAFYGDIAKKDMIMIAAVSGLVADPATEVDEGIRGLSGVLKLTEVTPIEPGPLGGVAKCGDTSVEGIKMGVCIWADKGSVGMIGIYFKDAAAVAAEFVKIRAEIEQRP